VSRVVVNEIEAKVGNDITFNDTVKIDTIKGNTAAGSITVQGEGTATTNLQQGLFKHLLHFNHQTPAIIKSFNASSVADDAAGEYTVTMTNAMSDINYFILASCNFEANGQSDARFNHSLNRDNSTGNEVAPTTTTYKVGTDDDSGNADLKYDYSGAMGDLA